MMRENIFMIFMVMGMFLVVVDFNRAGSSAERDKPRIELPFGSKLHLFNFYGISTIEGGEDNNLCVVGNNGIICVSEDEGKTWHVQDSGVKTELHDVKFAGAKIGWVVGRFGIILRTDDGGKSWSRLESPVKISLVSLSVIDEAHVWAVGEWGTILHSRDGKTWDLQHEKVDKVYHKVFFVDQSHGWVVGEFGTILHTKDGGKSWNTQQSPLGETTLFSVFFKDRQRGWIVSMDGHILATNNGGENWVQLESPTNKTLLDIKVMGDRGFAFGLEGTFINSNDGGRTWANSKGGLGTLSWLGSSSFTGGLKGWIAGGSGTILYTENGGKEWRRPLKLYID